MKYIFAVLLVVLNILNIPMSILYLRVQKWYLPMRQKDMVTFIAFAPFYWIIVGVATIVGLPCEWLGKRVH